MINFLLESSHCSVPSVYLRVLKIKTAFTLLTDKKDHTGPNHIEQSPEHLADLAKTFLFSHSHWTQAHRTQGPKQGSVEWEDSE